MSNDKLSSFLDKIETALLDTKSSESEGAQKQGVVKSYKDGVILIKGLSGLRMGEVVTVEGTNIKALVMNLEKDTASALVLEASGNVREGVLVTANNQFLKIPVSEEILGRIVNPLGEVLDGGGTMQAKEKLPLEKIAPGVITRKSVNQPVATGIKVIDAIIPIGRGQRELIIGDRQTGKTAIAIDTILNQKGQNMICVYVSIGQKDSKLRKIQTRLEEGGAMAYTVIVSAGSSEPAPLSYIAPYTGVSIAEYFMDQGKDVLIIYDDLSKHAVAYREISLLLRRPPGREAYPGDVFYLHSRLLERACRRNLKYGGGSITALPIIETQAGDVSAYIPTNVISITDGQIFLETDLFYKGIRPAVNVGLSVSRVGSSAQIKAMKKVAGTLKLDLAQFRELEAFSQFGSDLDESTKRQLERGKRAIEVLKQLQYAPIKTEHQVAVLYALTRGFMDDIPVNKIKEFEAGLTEYSEHNAKVFYKQVLEKKMWDEKGEEELKKVIADFKNNFTR